MPTGSQHVEQRTEMALEALLVAPLHLATGSFRTAVRRCRQAGVGKPERGSLRSQGVPCQGGVAEHHDSGRPLAQDHARHPPGDPAGGEFDTGTQPEASIVLDATAEL